MLKKYGIEGAKSAATPMSTTTKLTNDEKGKGVEEKLYRGMIKSLFYLAASRPDIMFSICLCTLSQSCPKDSHLSAVKRIFRYLSGSNNVGLWYPKNDFFDLVGYSDTTHVRRQLDRKSTSGAC